MNNKSLRLSFQVSIFFQIITGIVSMYGFFIPLAEKDYVLYDVLKIESLVQFIEGMWYFRLYYFLNQIKTNTIASKRYTDWYITTPIMLLSTAIYMEYKHGKFLTTKEILKEYRYSFLRLFLFNFLMLYFGYQYEINQKTKNLYTGFLFFFLSFYELWNTFAKKTIDGQNLFTFIFIVWFLYGIAAMYPTIEKNIFYNILDVVSKNFYGIFILYKIQQAELK